MQKQIITPNIATFKEGEVYVIQLPEEPTLSGSIGIVDYTRWTIAYEDWKQAVSYARANPFKVHEKDKEKVKALIWRSNFTISELYIDWVPQDLAEYRIELKMEIKKVPDYLTQNPLSSGYKQVACLIEDDGVKKSSAQKTEEAIGFHRNESIEFATWYSGMEREKVFKAYQRWKKETKNV